MLAFAGKAWIIIMHVKHIIIIIIICMTYNIYNSQLSFARATLWRPIAEIEIELASSSWCHAPYLLQTKHVLSYSSIINTKMWEITIIFGKN